VKEPLAKSNPRKDPMAGKRAPWVKKKKLGGYSLIYPNER